MDKRREGEPTSTGNRTTVRLPDPIAHAGCEREMMPIARRDVRSCLRDPDHRPARLELVERQPVVHHPLQIQSGHIHVLGVVEPRTRTQANSRGGS